MLSKMLSTKFVGPRIGSRLLSTCSSGVGKGKGKCWGECNESCEKRNEVFTVKTIAKDHPTHPKAQVKFYCPCNRKVAEESIDIYESDDMDYLNYEAFSAGVMWVRKTYPTIRKLKLYNEFTKQTVNWEPSHNPFNYQRPRPNVWGDCTVGCKRRTEKFIMRSDANYHPTNPQAEIKLYCPCYRKVAQEFIDLEASEDITFLNMHAIIVGYEWLLENYPTLRNVNVCNECTEAVEILNAAVPKPTNN